MRLKSKNGSSPLYVCYYLHFHIKCACLVSKETVEKRHWPPTYVSVTANAERRKEGLGEAFLLAMSACFWPQRGRFKGIFASIWQETSMRFPPGNFFFRKLMTSCVNIDRIQSGQKTKFHEIELERQAVRHSWRRMNRRCAM